MMGYQNIDTVIVQCENVFMQAGFAAIQVILLHG
jgi:hypothetical protein